MADDGDQITLATGLHPEDADAAVLVVEGDPLDDAGEVLAIGCGLWRYLNLRRSGSTAETDRADGEIGMEGAAYGDQADPAQATEIQRRRQPIRLESVEW